MELDQWVTVKQAAKILNVHDSRVRQMLISKKLTGMKIGDDEKSQWLVFRASVEEAKNRRRAWKKETV